MRSIGRHIFAAFALILVQGCAFFGWPGSDHGGSSRPPENDAPQCVMVDVAPYGSVEEALLARGTIDWVTDPRRAQACTLAFAAKELQEHLGKVGIQIAAVPLASLPPANDALSHAIVLACVGDPRTDPLLTPALRMESFKTPESFKLVHEGDTFYILGKARVGVLYGAYQLLSQLGFAWDDADHTVVPDPGSLDFTKIPSTAPEWDPSVAYRGFWTYGPGVPISPEFAVWMARNRFNLIGMMDPSWSGMLGIRQWGGGHELLQEVLSDPALFAAHPDWYALHNGVRQPISMNSVNYFNPCFANPEVGAYFSQVILDRLEHGDLKNIDILAIWPSDARTSYYFDQSPEALALGNPTDNLLFFYGIVAKNLRSAFETGAINRIVVLSGISYFSTWAPPTRLDIVQVLAGSNYIHVFYPIFRSYAGAVTDHLDQRTGNRRLMADLQQWRTFQGLRTGVVEYYNFSQYGGLPLDESQTFRQDYDALMGQGDGIFAYMHPVRSNPGPKRLLHTLMSDLTWSYGGNPLSSLYPAFRDMHLDELKYNYFKQRYGKWADRWQDIDRMMSNSLGNVEEVFADNSLEWCLFQASHWTQPFYSPAEIGTFIPRYLDGGDQWLPAKWSGEPEVEARFPGLIDSIRLQEQARSLWQGCLSECDSPAIRSNMERDVAWFEAARQRYLLMYDCAQLFQANLDGRPDLVPGLVARIKAEESYLRDSPVLADTFSPVDQRTFLDRVDKFLASL